MQLYKLADKYQALSNLIESEDTDDVCQEDVKVLISKIEDDFKDKAINIGKLILTANADIKSIDVEIDRLSLRKMNLIRKSEWFKEYLKEQMLTAQIDKIQGDVLNLSLRKSPPSVIVNDESVIPPEYFRIVPEQKVVNKIAILRHLLDSEGEIIPGCEIVTNKKYLVIK
jgi:hypothetical protein